MKVLLQTLTRWYSEFFWKCNQAVLPYQHNPSSPGLLPWLLTLHPFRAVSLLAAMEKPQTHYSHELLCHTWGSRLQEWNSKTQQSCKSSIAKTVETRTPKLINLDSRDDCFPPREVTSWKRPHISRQNCCYLTVPFYHLSFSEGCDHVHNMG